ncbi:uncharacterized protein [Venturia canescens]|nr:uncharacterized protein LOC122418305 isoform X2 [Venturia canescens]
MMTSKFPAIYVTQMLWENVDNWGGNGQDQNPIKPVTRDRMRGQQILQNLPPLARRFLFNPTFQNTVTNHNQNNNFQDAPAPENSHRRLSRGRVNPRTGAMEFDFRVSKPRKICFTIE